MDADDPHALGGEAADHGDAQVGLVGLCRRVIWSCDQSDQTIVDSSRGTKSGELNGEALPTPDVWAEPTDDQCADARLVTTAPKLRRTEAVGGELDGQPEVVRQKLQPSRESSTNLVRLSDVPVRINFELDLHVELSTDLGHA